MSTNHAISRGNIVTTGYPERAEEPTQVERLASFVVQAAYEDLSDEARRELKIRVLESLDIIEPHKGEEACACDDSVAGQGKA